MLLPPYCIRSYIKVNISENNIPYNEIVVEEEPEEVVYENVKKHIEGKTIVKIIAIPNRIVNIVVK